MQTQQNRCERIPESRPLRDPISKTPNPFAGVDLAPFDPLPVILKRRSCRRFNGGSLQRKTVEDMLAYALRSDEGEWRLAPESCELHLIALAVEGMRPGIYQLEGTSREWVLRQQGDFREACHHVCLGQELASSAALMLVTTANMATLTEKFGDRGYRYACLDAGLVGERINLFAVQSGLGSTGIGGYFDDMANEMLNAPLEQGILYITLAGISDEPD
jgi:SagB-type dehydrogenase family enzyme